METHRCIEGMAGSPRKRCRKFLANPLAVLVAALPACGGSATSTVKLDTNITLHVEDHALARDAGGEAHQPLHGGHWVRVNPSTHLFEDDMGRTRIFHGMNAVYKEAPYHPIYTGFDPEESLGEEDAANLARWGFNVVRLGVLWPGVEPERGVYNHTYLEAIDDIIAILARHGIYTMVDFHQDLLTRKFCGEGIPAWVEALILEEIPQDTRPFPWPVGAEYTWDEGKPGPDWALCRSLSFLKYYATAQVSAGFQALYDNVGGVLDSLAEYWRVVARWFADSPWVIGYDLINEPWTGDVFRRPRLLAQPGLAELVNLQPMYKKLHEAIREEDDRHVLFYEGFTWTYWPSGFSETPGGAGYEDRDAMSYHIYCPLSDVGVVSLACDPMNSQYFSFRRADVERLGGGSFLTEFGAVPNSTDHIRQLNQIMGGADDGLTSWAYWSLKDYHDVTTINGGQQSLYEGYSTPVPAKLAALSRTYAQVVAGEPMRMSFNPRSKAFHLQFVPTAFGALVEEVKTTQFHWTKRSYWTGEDSPDTTVIYLNYDLHYPDGFNVRIEPAQSAFLAADHNRAASKSPPPTEGWGKGQGARGRHVQGTWPPFCGARNRILIVSRPRHREDKTPVTVKITPCGKPRDISPEGTGAGWWGGTAKDTDSRGPCLCRRGDRRPMADRGMFGTVEGATGV